MKEEICIWYMYQLRMPGSELWPRKYPLAECTMRCSPPWHCISGLFYFRCGVRPYYSLTRVRKVSEACSLEGIRQANATTAPVRASSDKKNEKVRQYSSTSYFFVSNHSNQSGTALCRETVDYSLIFEAQLKIRSVAASAKRSARGHPSPCPCERVSLS